LNTAGTVRNTSRIVAAMNGVIMIARISAAVPMPVPNGGPWKRPPSTGTSPSVSVAQGCTYSAMTGTITKNPHMP
jgi:hypothetical protein